MPMTPDAAFDAFLDFVWRPDFDGARHDNAPGETFETVRGVTQIAWTDAQRRYVVPSSVALADATDDQLSSVLRRNFWDACRCDDIVRAGYPGVALVLANHAMAVGPRAAIKLLQIAVGANPDGIFGEMTAGKVNDTARAGNLPQILTAGIEASFAGMAKAPEFLKGWDRRADACLALAKTMAQ
jgi:lysozyme family protein